MDRSGFTLIEILIVVSIIGIIIATAIPSLLRSRMSANEASVIAGLKMIAVGQTDYCNNSQPPSYTGDLACLNSGAGAGGVRFVDPNLAAGLKAGYTFQLFSGTVIGDAIWSWSAVAWPITYQSTGVRSFYIDESGVVRGENIGGGPGTRTLPSLN